MVDPVADPLRVLAFRLFVAFGIGALVGMEREQSESGGVVAGSRTFPLFALYGALVGAFYPSLLPVALGTIAVPLAIGYAGKIWTERDAGLTTLSAALVVVVLGALTTHSERGVVVAVVVGGGVTALLSAKRPVHEFADRIEDRERRATVKFILVALVVFPLLPDRDVEVLLGLNPRFVWLMVVLVTGLSFVAYLASRVVGAERGITLTGVLGGFVSSTATTVTMAQRTSETPTLYRLCTLATVIAAVVMFPRALVEIAVVNSDLVPHVAVPLGGMTVAGVLAAGVLHWRTTAEEPVTTDDIENPFRLGPALAFGAVFAVVLVVSELANSLLGASGVYATAFVSGAAGVDAIALTLSRLASEGSISTRVATLGIVVAAVSNTAVKAGLAWALGTPRLGRRVAAVLGVTAAVGLVLGLLYP